MGFFEEILKDKQEENVFNEKKYEILREEYYFKFSELPPILIGYNYKHPIYTLLMESAIKNNKKIDDKDMNEIIKKYDFKADVIKE